MTKPSSLALNSGMLPCGRGYMVIDTDMRAAVLISPDGAPSWVKRAGPIRGFSGFAVLVQHDVVGKPRSDRDPLDDVARHSPPPAVVELGRLRVRVSGQVLDVFERDVLLEQVGHDEHTERVGAEHPRQPGRGQPPFQHPADQGGAERSARQRPAVFAPRPPGDGGLEQGSVRRRRDRGSGQVGEDPLLEVVSHGDFAVLTVLLEEPELALGPVVLQVAAAEPRQGAHSRSGVDEGAEDGAVPQSDDGGEVDRGEQVAGLGDGDLGGLAVGAVFLGPDGGEGVEGDDVSLDEPVPELLEGGSGLVLGAGRSGQLLDEAPGRARGDPGQLEVLELAPVEEPADGA